MCHLSTGGVLIFSLVKNHSIVFSAGVNFAILYKWDVLTRKSVEEGLNINLLFACLKIKSFFFLLLRWKELPTCTKSI